ncbi:hypothetical protein [Streptomyces nigrescens]|uniref:Transposase n=1 Tax=Streptomyces nigrescens TaxID=1920 RepID=A0ABY7IV86_STRNI|nr:hypothetical protein [Streptomyces nigrescens]WAU02255.1 hypothetical protein STRNI_000266 [Streptomyces nigrescens]
MSNQPGTRLVVNAASCSAQSRRASRAAVATRYEKLAVRYEATVLVAAINEWR